MKNFSFFTTIGNNNSDIQNTPARHTRDTNDEEKDTPIARTFGYNIFDKSNTHTKSATRNSSSSPVKNNAGSTDTRKRTSTVALSEIQNNDSSIEISTNGSLTYESRTLKPDGSKASSRGSADEDARVRDTSAVPAWAIAIIVLCIVILLILAVLIVY